jgi:hypothetical protein
VSRLTAPTRVIGKLFNGTRMRNQLSGIQASQWTAGSIQVLILGGGARQEIVADWKSNEQQVNIRHL